MNDNSPELTETDNTSMATTSLVCSILGLVPLLGFVFGTAGLVFGILALRRHYYHPDRYGGVKRATLAIIIWATLMAAWTWAFIYYPETIFT